MNKPVLRVQDLAVTFTSFTGGILHRKERTLRAVDGISFELNAGETIGIVGESGSGKSTLARAILGLIKPIRGRVQWMGERGGAVGEQLLENLRCRFSRASSQAGLCVQEPSEIGVLWSEARQALDRRRRGGIGAGR